MKLKRIVISLGEELIKQIDNAKAFQTRSEFIRQCIYKTLYPEKFTIMGDRTGTMKGLSALDKTVDLDYHDVKYTLPKLKPTVPELKKLIQPLETPLVRGKTPEQIKEIIKNYPEMRKVYE